MDVIEVIHKDVTYMVLDVALVLVGGVCIHKHLLDIKPYHCQVFVFDDI